MREAVRAGEADATADSAIHRASGAPTKADESGSPVDEKPDK